MALRIQCIFKALQENEFRCTLKSALDMQKGLLVSKVNTLVLFYVFAKHFLMATRTSEPVLGMEKE